MRTANSGKPRSPASGQPADAPAANARPDRRFAARLEALKLPKFLEMQSFVWPFLLLGVAVAGCSGLALRSAGR